MNFRNRLKDHNALMRVGMLFLLLASLWRWFSHPSAGFSARLMDGITGLLYGLSIGCLLLALKRNGRRCSTTEDQPRA